MPNAQPRIPPIERSEWTDEVRDVFAVLDGPEGWENGPSRAIIGYLAQHPDLTRPFLTFNRYLLFHPTFPDRERELVILYVAWTCNSEYEWVSHVQPGLRAGLTEDAIEAVKQGSGSRYWSETDRDLLRAVDQLRDCRTLDDDLWASLSERYDRRQMMELLFIIGNYIMFSAILNGLRIPLEEGASEIAEKYGAP